MPEPRVVRNAKLDNGDPDFLDVPMGRVIVSAAVGLHYPDLQRRTLAACCEHCPDADRQFTTEPGGVWGYEMKLAAIRQARAAGHWRFLLWMDVSFQPVASIEPLWRHIEQHGWFAPEQGSAKLGAWVSDDALAQYGIGREQAHTIPLCLSGLVGLDLLNPIAVEILERWTMLSRTFAGPHYNRPGEEMRAMGNKFTGHVSADPEVEGHRHDEAALSFVLWQMGLAPVKSRFLEIDQPEGFIVGRNFQRRDGVYAS